MKKIKQKLFYLFISSLIGSVLLIIYIQFNTFSEQRIVSGDFRIGWAIINISYAIIYFFGYNFFSSSKINKLSLNRE
jgi:hypothetical protein